LGKTKKLILDFDKITKLIKANNKFSKSIKLFVKNGQQDDVYRFSGFSERDFTFKYIKRLWSNASQHAPEEDDDESEASENEEAT
jgi:hypothetical protein